MPCVTNWFGNQKIKRGLTFRLQAAFLRVSHLPDIEVIEEVKVDGKPTGVWTKIFIPYETT